MVTNDLLPETAVVIGHDAYVLNHSDLVTYYCDSSGQWHKNMKAWMCNACFGDHSFGYSLMCTCCGGTGWEIEDFDYCVGQPLVGDMELCVEIASPKVALLALIQTTLPILDPIRADVPTDITSALVRGRIAKIEITTNTTRYMALLGQEPDGAWCLDALAALCNTCMGSGKNLDDKSRFCPSCGGIKWGKPGALRYCYNKAPGWWTLLD